MCCAVSHAVTHDLCSSRSSAAETVPWLALAHIERTREGRPKSAPTRSGRSLHNSTGIKAGGQPTCTSHGVTNSIFHVEHSFLSGSSSWPLSAFRQGHDANTRGCLHLPYLLRLEPTETEFPHVLTCCSGARRVKGACWLADRPYRVALRALKASSRPPAKRASAVFQLMTFQMFSTYAALPLRYYRGLSGMYKMWPGRMFREYA